MTARLHRGFQRFVLATLPAVVAGTLTIGMVSAQAAPTAKSKKAQQTAGKTAGNKSNKAGGGSKTAAAQVPMRTKSADKGRVMQSGSASWYGPGFHGRKTASGEKFDMYELTAAHKTLPLGSRVMVRNPANGKEVVVRINDRGPYAAGRILDLSKAAASQLGLISRGHGDVELQAMGDGADGIGLSATKLARAGDEDSSPQRVQQAQLLAKTKFGDSNLALGNTVQSEEATWPARTASVDVGPPLGLSTDIASVVEAPRMGLNWSPWLRVDWGMQRLASNFAEASPDTATAEEPVADKQAVALKRNQIDASKFVRVKHVEPAAIAAGDVVLSADQSVKVGPDVNAGNAP